MRTATLALLLLAGSTVVPEAKTQESLKPTNLVKINTKADEADPFPGADGLTLYYAANATGNFDLMLARRTSAAAAWSAGKPLTALNTNTADERSPCLTSNNRLYFATNRISDEKFKDLQNHDLWVKLGQGAAVPLLIANTAADEMHPWVALEGKEFYFSRKTKDGWRVCFSPGPEVAVIGQGTIIEDLPPGFQHATLSPHGLTMYLQGPKDEKKSAIFRSTRATLKGKWSQPEEVGGLFHVESVKGDLSPALNATGTILYFASDRPGGQGGLDLWWIKTSELGKKK